MNKPVIGTYFSEQPVSFPVEMVVVIYRQTAG